ncbi:MAG: hypothetical protein RIT45_2232 [Pseudomonadota bacterium]|jgi:RND family efflux transporter MFP subunit
MVRTALKILLPLLLLAVGVGFAVRMVKTRPKAKRAKPPEAALVVDVAVPVQDAARADVEAHGTVTADRVVQLAPQVSGIIEKIGDDVVPGVRLRAGQRIAVIDDRDLRIVLDQRQADLVRARFELDVERGRGEVADREWKMLGGAVKSSKLGAELAQRKPHIEAAKARVEAAKSAVEKARIDIARTRIVAPFDCVVRERRVAEGQLVSPQAPIVVLVATDRFFVTANVPVEKLGFIDVPGLRGVADGAGAEVRIRQRTSEGELIRRGKVERLLSDLDPAARMARVLVSVPNPLDPPEGQLDALPLLLGSYVSVTIEGRPVQGVRVPRLALREGSRVFTIEDGRLAFHDVEVVWRASDSFVVRGLDPGVPVVLSRLAAPEPGMKLEIRGAPRTKATAQDAPATDGGDAAAREAEVPAAKAAAPAAAQAPRPGSAPTPTPAEEATR